MSMDFPPLPIIEARGKLAQAPTVHLVNNETGKAHCVHCGRNVQIARGGEWVTAPDNSYSVYLCPQAASAARMARARG